MSNNNILVCIGNSIVNGFPHRRSQSFSSILRDTTDYNVINKGVNGDTTAGMKYRFEHDVLSKHPGCVMLLTGSNDFIMGSSTVEKCMKDIKELSEAVTVQGGRMILLTPILCDPEKASASWIPADYETACVKLKQLAALMKDYAEESDCQVIDLQEGFKACSDFVDGVHPTVAGQKFIADFIRSQLPPL